MTTRTAETDRDDGSDRNAAGITARLKRVEQTLGTLETTLDEIIATGVNPPDDGKPILDAIKRRSENIIAKADQIRRGMSL